jgi:hypothetical protein
VVDFWIESDHGAAAAVGSPGCFYSNLLAASELSIMARYLFSRTAHESLNVQY